MTNGKDKYIKQIDNSADAYAKLKPITDAAQAGVLKPWSPAVVDLLESYGVKVERKKGVKVQTNLSFPTSIKDHRSMAIGARYAKEDGSFAEDLYVFIKGVGLTCYYRGTQEQALPEYDGSHHEKVEIKLTEYLPDIQKELADIKQQITDLKTITGVELITDEMHLGAMQDVQNESNEAVRSFRNAHGNSPSAVEQYSRAVQMEASKKRRQLMEKKALSDRVYQSSPPPEIALVLNAQANTNKFDVRLVNNSSRTIVAECIIVNGIETTLNQQFRKLSPIENVNIPDGIFDNETSEVLVEVYYRTLDGKSYVFSQKGEPQLRADKRFNYLFNEPPEIKSVSS
ncbi:MAG TPA: hypothetical protein VMR45_00155 [Patescibacteria group bacterium]|nr:hypothetical protein [Patescibacteria group bacterium]